MLDPIITQKIESAIDKRKAGRNWFTGEQLAAFFNNFRAKFGPEVLAGLEGTALLEALHGSQSTREFKKDSLAYWLEYKDDDEFPRNFGIISGGSAYKFGLYVDKTGQWMTGSSQKPRVVSEQEAVQIAQKQRDQFLRGCKLLDELPSNGTDADYSELQKNLLEMAPDVCETAWGHKYFSLLYPDKLEDFHVEHYQRFNLIKLLQVPPEGRGRYLSAGRYVTIANELGLPINRLTTALCEMGCTPYRYWRVGTTVGETNESHWELMREGNYVSIGWRIGDLTSFADGQQSKDPIKKLLKDQYYPDKPQVAGTKSTEIFQFISTISTGDLVIASEGERVRGVGKITGPYVYNEELDFPHCRPVEWLNLEEWKIPASKGLLRSTVREVHDAHNLVEIEKRTYERPSVKHYWVEKTLVKNRSDRESGDYAVGSALWSPQKGKTGRKIYSAMQDVQPGDVILHLTNNKGFSGVSVAASSPDPTFIGLQGTNWEGMPSFLIRLNEYKTLDPPLNREEFLDDPAVFAQLARLLEQYRDRGLFYNKEHDLNQGAYLTEAPAELIGVLNNLYKEKTGRNLPHVDAEPPPPPQPRLVLQPRYTVDNLLEDTGFERTLVDKWIRALDRKKQIILQGPPGTGKTYVAERLARLRVSETEGFYEVIQFHPTYAYEDFIQGIKPSVQDGAISYDIADGRFLEFCAAAEECDGAPCVLIIDEINRANLSRVFGELMYLLEYRKKTIPLAYGGKFTIPENVFLIGTMNTADRSIALVDHAFRRRFSFIYLAPDYGVLERYLNQYELPADSLIAVLKLINATIDDPHYEVGISFFLKDGARLKETLQDIWHGEIEPYLEEYFYDRPEKIEPFRWELLIEDGLAAWPPNPLSTK